MRAFVIFGLFVAAAVAVPMPEADKKLDCFSHEEFLPCMAIKANSMINRAARSANIEIFQGVTFVKDGSSERSAKSLESETSIMESLPADSTDKAVRLVAMLYDSVTSFFSSHSLKVDAPEGSLARSLEEARSKLLAKKSWTPIMLALGAKFLLLLPVIFGGLSLLVLKSLFIGKIALIIAGILGFQKIFGAGSSVGSYASNFLNKVQPSGNYYDGAGQGWQTSGGQIAQPAQGGYYKRSIDENKVAQSLAYSAHAQSEVNPTA